MVDIKVITTYLNVDESCGALPSPRCGTVKRELKQATFLAKDRNRLPSVTQKGCMLKFAIYLTTSVVHFYF